MKKSKKTGALMILATVLSFFAIVILMYIENYEAIQAGGIEHIIERFPSLAVVPILIVVLIYAFVRPHYLKLLVLEDADKDARLSSSYYVGLQ